MLKQNWISSTYTDLNLSIDSPDALYRSPDSTINKLTFISSNKNLEINLITKPIDENSDLSNELINDFKERNFINVITKNEDFQTEPPKRPIARLGTEHQPKWRMHPTTKPGN